MPLPTDRPRLLPIASASALALAATLGAGAALVASPATASGPAYAAPQTPREATVRVGTGTAAFCLTPEAGRALAKSGIRLAAVAPAKLTGPAGRRCVSAPISGGEFNTGFTAGHLDFGGGFDFVRQDRRHLRVDSLRGDLATSRLTARVGGSKARRTDFLAFRVDPNRIKVGGGQVRAQMAFTLTDRGVGAFRDAFHGRSPLGAGRRMFDGDGTARLATQAAGSTSPGSTGAQQQAPKKQTPATGTPKQQTSGTPKKQTPGTARKQTPNTPHKQTPNTPHKQAPSTTHKQSPGQTPKQAPKQPVRQAPATPHQSPADDTAVDPVNDVAMGPLHQIANG
ncbi:hypothetical protein [Streptomyces sp. NPDC052496]|uniref:hypothetical protein n=1 Tax=Streptomyces sp. NPDC052496 TaxID=3154951 RepID=UPI00343BBCBC